MKSEFNLQGLPALAFRSYGEKSTIPLVLIHGFCEDSRIWESMLSFLSGHYVLCIDLPGFGFSQSHTETSIEAYAHAIRAVLLHEGHSECVLLGHSMGGYTTLCFAEKFPECLVGFGLIHSHPFADSQTTIKSRNQGIAILKEGKQKSYLNILFPKLFHRSYISKHPETISRLVQQAEAYPTKGIVNALKAMRDRPDRTAVLRDSKIPVFLFIGQEDALLPPFQKNEMLLLPSVSAIHIEPKVGHMGMFECPERLGAAISNFYTFVMQHVKG